MTIPPPDSLLDTLFAFPVWRDSALAAVPAMVQEPGALLWVLGLGAVVGGVVFLAMFVPERGDE